MNDLQIPEFLNYPVKTLADLERENAPKKTPKHTKVYEIEKTIIKLTIAFLLGMFVMYWSML